MCDSQDSSNIQEHDSFLNTGKLDIPSIYEGCREQLEAEITKEEIGRATDCINARKKAGPDGFPIDFYTKS